MSAYQIQPEPIIAGLPPFDTCIECAQERTVPYIIGPALEIRLNRAFSLDLEALYSRVDYDHSSGSFGPTPASPFFRQTIGIVTSTKHIIDRWEFPLLVEYTIRPAHRLRPFVEAGISIQHSRDREAKGLVAVAGGSIFMPLTVISLMPSPGSVVDTTVVAGPTFGAGASLRARRFRPSLEVRFTRWNHRAVRVGPSRLGVLAPPIAISGYNQVQLLLGIMF